MKLGNEIYYQTESEDVTSFKNKQILINEDYNYLPSNPIYKFLSWITYRLIATPYAFIFFKLIKKVKFHNKEILSQHKKSGYFIYANHTNHLCDGFCPALICFPKKPNIIVNSSNISMPFWGKFTKMWGALPTPNSIGAMKNFNKAIEHILKQNNPIVIYPEAHLWPYYTKIRNFPTTSFRFPIKYNKPVFTFTTVYKKQKHKKKPKIEIYVDGPFYVNTNLPEKNAQSALHDVVYNKLKERASLSDYEFIKYIKRSEND